MPKKRSSRFEKEIQADLREAWASFSLAQYLFRCSSIIKHALILRIYEDIILYYLTTKNR